MSGKIRGLLHRAWYPFLGRFPHPTEIQEQAIPAILSGLNVLLASATATGKTEAYAAPLAERMLREKWGSPGILVVSPTRALVNDLFRRLEAPLGELKLTLARKTGDHATWEPAAVVITTPESLDSLLARRPEVLKTVRAVVLDELHVMDQTARGDQLAILLARLERIVMAVAAQRATRGLALPIPLQRVAATATAGHVLEVADRYLGRGATVVSTEERRDIQADLVEGTDGPAVSAYLLKACRGANAARKVLIFTNSRAEAENLAASCNGRPPFGPDVFVHHASLSRNERERVESRFLSAPSALCVATMTLELGIDIGDIDLVGLIGAPPSVASLLQRVGRGNRRAWDVTRVACFHDSPGQQARFEHLLECARRGALLQEGRTFRPGVLVQQAYSLAYQNRNRFVDAKTFAERLPAGIAGEYGADRLEELLDHLAAEEWLMAAPGGRYQPAPRLEALYARGMIHSNISRDSGGDLEVVDAATERVVGYVSLPARADATQIPKDVIIGGQRRQVTRVKGTRLRTSASGVAAGAQFRGQGSPSVARGLAQSFARFLGVAECRVPVVRLEKAVLLGHFLGTAYGRLFLECVQRATPGLSGVGNGFVSVFATEQMPLLEFREGDVLSEITRHRRAFSGALQDSPMASRLPARWWSNWLFEALDVPAFLAVADTLQLYDEVAPRLARVLVSLAPRGTSAAAYEEAWEE